MLQTIATYCTPLDAHVSRSLLESEGIPAVVADEHMSALYGNVTGGVRLQVSEQDVTRALSILTQHSDDDISLSL